MCLWLYSQTYEAETAPFVDVILKDVTVRTAPARQESNSETPALVAYAQPT